MKAMDTNSIICCQIHDRKMSHPTRH